MECLCWSARKTVSDERLLGGVLLAGCEKKCLGWAAKTGESGWLLVGGVSIASRKEECLMGVARRIVSGEPQGGVYLAGCNKECGGQRREISELGGDMECR